MTDIEMMNLARELKKEYNDARSLSELATVVDKMADFIDIFIQKNQ